MSPDDTDPPMSPPVAAPRLAIDGARVRESQNNLEKPLGVDVAGAIMGAVRDVSEKGRLQISQVMTRCQTLLNVIAEHEQEVEASLLARDRATRDILLRHGELSVLIGEECARTHKALDAIGVAFAKGADSALGEVEERGKT